MKYGFAILTIVVILFSMTSEARERNRELRKGNPHRKGNERSERVREINVGQANYGGNGCPEGSMSAVFAPDNLSFSILFDQFIAEVNESAKKRDVMNCTALIPIQIPENTQMEIIRVDYRGFVGLPEGSRAVLNSVFNFRGRKGENRDKMNLRYLFQGPVMDDYTVSTGALDDEGESDETERSPCGGNVLLQITNRLQVVSRKGEQASVTLDSVDGQNNTVYYVNWRRCEDREGRGNGRGQHR